MDPGRSLFLYLVHPDDRMDRDQGELHALELRLETLDGRVHQDGAGLLEQQTAHLDESVEVGLNDARGVDLVDLALVVEGDAEDAHGSCRLRVGTRSLTPFVARAETRSLAWGGFRAASQTALLRAPGGRQSG